MRVRYEVSPQDIEPYDEVWDPKTDCWALVRKVEVKEGAKTVTVTALTVTFEMITLSYALDTTVQVGRHEEM